jgi:aspartate-semialdehyde dehydrogenase
LEEYAGVQVKWPINTLFIEMQFHNVMSFEENGYQRRNEMVRETQKILDDKTIAVTATAVRVPIVGAQQKRPNVQFQK